MRIVTMLICSSCVTACSVKMPNDGSASSSTQDSSSETGSMPTEPSDASNNVEWALGHYYRPSRGELSSVLATIEILPDHRALLAAHQCKKNAEIAIETFELVWDVQDEDSIIFSSVDSTEPFVWFGGYPSDQKVTLSKTESSAVVLVTDGKIANSYNMGTFRRSNVPICLVVVDTTVSCEDGKTIVKECPTP